MRLKPICVSVTLALIFAWATFGDETSEKGRAVFEANKDAVVTVRTAMSLSFGGNENERLNEGNGTVIDPSGLTVLSLTSVDPSSFYESMRDSGAELTTKVTSIKILLADGTELESEVVLRDKDLDLAFVRPKEKPEKPMAHVDLDNAAEPRLLDEVVVLAQLGKVARRAHSVSLARVEAIMEKPRTFYLLGEHLARLIVCSPAFTLDGKFVGIGVLRAIKGEGGGGMSDNVLAVIVPAEDIKEGAAQAPASGETAPAAEATDAEST